MLLHKLPSLFPWKHNKTKIMAEPVLEEDVNLEEQLAPCTICGRTFLPKPLIKHSGICERNATKKRKIFNSLKQRVEGTDLALFHQKTLLSDKSKSPVLTKPVQPTWKQKHQELVSAIRAAKGSTETVQTPVKPRSMSLVNTGFERCPSCDRQFGPKAFDRHVEWCKERKPRMSHSPNVLQAKERLDARIKYRVPPVNKPKKTVKEKYQSPVKTENFPASKSMSQLERRPSVRAAPSTTVVKKIEKVEKAKSEIQQGQKSPEIKNTKTAKSCGKKLPVPSKINAIGVNSLTSGLTVSKLKTPMSPTHSDSTASKSPNQKYVTWKDIAEPKRTFKKCNSGAKGDAANQPKTFKDLPKLDLNSLSSEVNQKNNTDKTSDSIEINGIFVKNRLTEDQFTLLKTLPEQQQAVLQGNMVFLSPKDENVFLTYRTAEDDVSLENKIIVLVPPNIEPNDIRIHNTKTSKLHVKPSKSESRKKDVDAFIEITDYTSNSTTNNKLDQTSAPRNQETSEFPIRDISNRNNRKLANAFRRKGSPDALDTDAFRISDSKIPTITRTCEGDKPPSTNIDDFLSAKTIVNKCFNAENDANVTSTNKITQLENFSDYTPSFEEFVSTGDSMINLISPIKSNNSSTSNFGDSSQGDTATTSRRTDNVPIKLASEVSRDNNVPTAQLINIPSTELDYFKQTLNSTNSDPLDFSIVNRFENFIATTSSTEDKNFNIFTPQKDVVVDNFKNDKPRSSEEIIKEFRISTESSDIVITGNSSESNTNTTEHIDKSQNKYNPPIEYRFHKNSDKNIFLEKFFLENGNPETNFKKSKSCSSTDNYREGSPVILSKRRKLDDRVVGKESKIFEFMIPEKLINNTNPTQQNQYELNDSNIDRVIYEKKDYLDEIESFQGIFPNEHSCALSKARLEGEVRKCCSDVSINSTITEDNPFISYSESNILKFHLSTDDLKPKLTTDQILEIAGEQFLKSVQSESDRESARMSSPEEEEDHTDGDEFLCTKIYQNCLSDNIKKIKCRKLGLKSDNSINVIPQTTKFSEMNIDPIPEETYFTLVNHSDEEESASQLNRCTISEVIKEESINSQDSEVSEPIEVIRNEPSARTRSENIFFNEDNCIVLITEEKDNESVNKPTQHTFKFCDAECRIRDDCDETCNQSRPISSISSVDYSPRFLNLTNAIMSDSSSKHKLSNTFFNVSQYDCRRFIKLDLKTLPKEEKERRNKANFKLPDIQKGNVVEQNKEKKRESIVLPEIVHKNSATLKDNPDFRDEYNPFESAERQLLELLACDDFKPFKSSSPSNNYPNSPKKSKTVKETNAKNLTNKRASVIDPPCSFRDSDVFDDNFELIENFINDNLSDDTILDKLDAISLSSNKTGYTLNDNYCDELSIDPMLINEFDNLSIPEHLIPDDTSPVESFSEKKHKTDKKPGKTPSKIKERVKTTKHKNSELSSSSFQQKKRNLSSLKNSISVLDPIKPKNLKSKEDVQNYFHEQEVKNSPKNVKSEKSFTVTNVVSPSEDLFSIDDEMYEEYKKYEQMYLQEKEERTRLDRKAQSEDEGLVTKMSGDSAYGSLSRGRQKVRARMTKLVPLDVRDSDCCSSGSETCVQIMPSTIADTMNVKVPSNHMCVQMPSNHSNVKMPKFCHECGSQYPVTSAKYCIECGVKRLVL